jgi:tetratricopeptide (TPR) repeat protein
MRTMEETLIMTRPSTERRRGRGGRWGVRIAHVALLVWGLAGLGGLASAQSSDQSVAAWLRDGNFYFSQGDCALAQYFFQEALKVQPRNVEALVGRGRALACQGNFGSAVDSLREAIAVDGSHVPAYVQLALAYQQQFAADRVTFASRLAEAAQVLDTAANLAPNDPTVQNTRGIIFYEAGDLTQARAAFERAVSLAAEAGMGDRERSVIQSNLGRAYRDLGLLELAFTAFRRAVVLDPASSSARNNLGNVLFRLGDCAAAEYELSQAVSLASKSLSAVSQLAIVLFECANGGDVSASIPYFERALDLEGAVFLPPLYTYLARAYLAAGRIEDALRRAQQGALLPPESAEAQLVLGRVYAARGAQGDTQAARAAFERALELDPLLEDARSALNALR